MSLFQKLRGLPGAPIIIALFTLIMVGGLSLRAGLEYHRVESIEQYERFMQERKAEDALGMCRSSVHVIPKDSDELTVLGLRLRCDHEDHVTATCDEGAVSFVACVCNVEQD